MAIGRSLKDNVHDRLVKLNYSCQIESRSTQCIVYSSQFNKQYMKI